MRSTWDYERGCEEFLAWARSVPRMLNSAEVFAWNTDKAYLPELGGRRRARRADAGRSSARRSCRQRSRGLGRGPAPARSSSRAWARAAAGSWSSTGPTAVRPTSTSPSSGPAPGWCSRWSSRCAPRGRPRCSCSTARWSRRRRSVPAAGEIRVHEAYGGTTVAVPRSPRRRPSWPVVRSRRPSACSASRLDYARVDQMRLADGTLAVSELEVTEPGLYLEVLPEQRGAPSPTWWRRGSRLADAGTRRSGPSGSHRPKPGTRRLHSVGASAKNAVGTLQVRVTEAAPKPRPSESRSEGAGGKGPPGQPGPSVAGDEAATEL